VCLLLGLVDGGEIRQLRRHHGALAITEVTAIQIVDPGLGAVCAQSPTGLPAFAAGFRGRDRAGSDRNATSRLRSAGGTIGSST
jgi:hypothetical protein